MTSPYNSRVIRYRFVFAVLCLVVTTSCATVRGSNEQPELYLGADITIAEPMPLGERRALQRAYDSALRPQPNSSLLGLWRPRLQLFQLMGGEDAEGMQSWVQNRFAEAPVRFTADIPESNAQRLRNTSYAWGYFDAELSYDVENPRTDRVRLSYEIRPGQRYQFGELRYGAGDTDESERPEYLSTIDEAIARQLELSELSRGDSYHLDALEQERIRIDAELKDQGFYAFSTEHLIFEGRRDRDRKKVDLSLDVREDISARAARQYRLRRIFLYLEYSVESEDPPEKLDELEQIAERVYIVQSGTAYRSSIVLNALDIEPGDLYRRTDHLRSLSRLSDLGIFQFTSIRYRETVEPNRLDAYVYLTPAPSRLVQAELQAVSRSDDFAGPAVNFAYRDMNAFGGAEELSVQTNAALETRLREEAGRVIGSYEYGAEAGLSFPRVPAPFAVDQARTGSLPRTRIRLGIQSLTRVESYRLDSANARFGYSWRSNPRLRHELDPVDITFVRSGEFASEFEQQLDANPLLARSFEQQFLAGSRYSLIYSNQDRNESRAVHYFQLGLESSGAVLNLVQQLSGTDDSDDDEPAVYLNTPYAQFVRTDADFRQFIPLIGSQRIAMRLLAGMGYAYGNSDTLPRIRKFSVGGTNSMRAFAARSIGPGSIAPENDNFADRTGALRLETNLELRFPITTLFRGAVFWDIGNIWELAGDTDSKEGEFGLETFLNDLAVGSGIGLRFDPGFAVLRLDVAFPVRKPWIEERNGWLIQGMQPLEPEWLRDNLVYNLAIGYPF
jgi:outer membrane protein insertion porin family